MNENIALSKIRAIESVLPAEFKAVLGEMNWAERVQNAHQEGTKIRVNFFSDGLSLSVKSDIEKMIREILLSDFELISVYFEKKNKTTESSKASPSEEHAGQNKSQPKTQKPPSGKRPIAGVKRVIAVASGKGGVGKSTVSVNLALALHNQGYKVGLLDADVYGPSIPTMLNIHKDPEVNENQKIIPIESFGLKVMSFGFFAPEETAVIWRGPMIMKALQQFFWDVDWGELDFLVIDLPPGTGDAQLTLVQSIPITGAVIVTTPQNVALLDAVKGIAMFQKTEVPILGVVENMSSFTCPACGSESSIFGAGGAERVSQKFAVPLLGHVPLIPEIRVAGDVGEPLTAVAGHGVRMRFSEIAEKVVQQAVAVTAK